MDDVELIKKKLKKLLTERRRLKQNIRCRLLREKWKKIPGWIEKEKIRHHNDYVKNKPLVLARSTLWRKTNPKRANEIRRNHYWNKKLGVRWKP